MAEKAAKNDIVVIDPMFSIPDGMTDFYSSEVGVNSSGEEDPAIDGVSDIYSVDTEGVTQDMLTTPNIIEVVSQTVRVSASGDAVVDLVIEVDDIPGALEYEFRVSNA